ncbi:hypothetical protein CDAR_516201 [Caerostris darwini]|uniref:Uncharacterized protein n=1 Tax=Caerostris darwini TaxID=1538125 RepID=A0AAV4X2N8_9ARAC|nr:hypothetical protein CDAR_516201 [Caerostris darwini]
MKDLSGRQVPRSHYSCREKQTQGAAETLSSAAAAPGIMRGHRKFGQLFHRRLPRLEVYLRPAPRGSWRAPSSPAEPPGNRTSYPRTPLQFPAVRLPDRPAARLGSEKVAAN